MPHISPALTLLPQQCRLINAAEGFRLEVYSGCLWLTRPGDCVDRFLVRGAVIDLHEAQVLIQCDTHPGAAGGVAARYVMVPLKSTPGRPKLTCTPSGGQPQGWAGGTLCAPRANRYRQWFKRLTRQAGNYVQGLAEVSTRAGA